MFKRSVILLCVMLFVVAIPGVASAGGADVRIGDVVPVPVSDEDSNDISGWVMIKRHKGDTKLTVQLTGLKPNGQYHGHLHVDECKDKGPHYQDVPGGHPHPPNELHLVTFTAKPNGTALVKATADWIARDEARSVFIHDGPAGHHSPKVACGEFPDS